MFFMAMMMMMLLYLIVKVHGVGDVVTELACIQFIMTDSLQRICKIKQIFFWLFWRKKYLVIRVELPGLLAGLIYHIVVDVRVVSWKDGGGEKTIC